AREYYVDQSVPARQIEADTVLLEIALEDSTGGDLEERRSALAGETRRIEFAAVRLERDLALARAALLRRQLDARTVSEAGLRTAAEARELELGIRAIEAELVVAQAEAVRTGSPETLERLAVRAREAGLVRVALAAERAADRTFASPGDSGS
ncbi:MAG: hypothetical protein AAF690_26205, partial [Acidobacteriota bacterium]